MSKLSVARRLADTLGTSVDEAMQFVDDVGAQQADSIAVNIGDDAAEEGISNWWKAAGAGAIAGGGALAWRQQDVNRAEALAQQQQTYSEAMRSIIESDLPGELKAELARNADDAATPPGGGNQTKKAGNDPLGFLSGALGSPQTILVLMIVLVVAMNAGGD